MAEHIPYEVPDCCKSESFVCSLLGHDAEEHCLRAHHCTYQNASCAQDNGLDDHSPICCICEADL